MGYFTGSCGLITFSNFQFIIFMLTLIVVEISIGIWSMVLWSRVAHKSEVLMINSFEGFVNDNFDKKDWVNLQSQVRWQRGRAV